jgi:hypothetical protein
MTEKRTLWFCLTMIAVTLICMMGMVLSTAILSNSLRKQNEPYPLFIQRTLEPIGYPSPAPAPIAEPIHGPLPKE